LEGVPVHNPSHPSFSPSSVLVPIPAAPRFLEQSGELLGELEEPIAVGEIPPPPFRVGWRGCAPTFN
jgi:hypothetical protein